MVPPADSFKTKSLLQLNDGALQFYSLKKMGERVEGFPFSIKVILESLLRQEDGVLVTADDIRKIMSWTPAGDEGVDIPFIPARVVLQDFTGVPSVVDLAAMRDAMKELGGDPSRINPLVPVDLTIDHSVQTDYYGTCYAQERNEEVEMQRNRERYSLLKWAQGSFDNFRVVPPGNGIIHQVNLECLAPVVWKRNGVAYPDSVFGTDSHTTQINGLGVVGWGVGGIEAEAVMLGQPYYMPLPQVVGFKLRGKLPKGVTATDMVLTAVEMLRKKGVVGKFVEFYGPGIKNLSLPDRATLANMAPEYGATMGFFPVDEVTVAYLRKTGRKDLCDLVETYCREQGLFYEGQEPEYSDYLELDLSKVVRSLAGPKRPQDRIELSMMKERFDELVSKQGGAKKGEVMKDGDVLIASITSCTNTSNPSVMMTAGLLAKKAVERGLRPNPNVKTSLAPGSRAVTAYLQKAGLMPYLEALGFHVVGYGCLTCIGNSGPTRDDLAADIVKHDLTVAAVLSGNRNFEGRISPYVKANYLASPPLVVAFAIAGRVDLDMEKDPLGTDPNGDPVYLNDIWPSPKEVNAALTNVDERMYRQAYSTVFQGSDLWNRVPAPKGKTFKWEPYSTYIRKVPFFEGMTAEATEPRKIHGARALAVLGDSITTDHISPAGGFSAASVAGKYLLSLGVKEVEFNSYGSRRGNHEVMMRGTFANIRLKNAMAKGREGDLTALQPEDQVMDIFSAAQEYRRRNVPLIVLAGKEYGTGSSRDWAAKGPQLLGVKAVIAESFERIHRSNLVGMGVLPLQFTTGQSASSLGLDGSEEYDVEIAELRPRAVVTVKARKGTRVIEFQAVARLDTPVEVDYYRNGGILQAVLRKLTSKG
ncbi:MAG: aconitate hydratase AcnA [Methanomassiliicoccales archaeon]|nr:aconitate hydratase AcnA [Methanomassiliicoccales archaeon]TFG56085.1 MAG: aconitate hydratase AcnA [Methanomassiliicoccus sp.]